MLNVGCLHCAATVPLHVSVESLDLSHNNISFINQQYFKPVEMSLIHLNLRYNELLEATNDVFGRMGKLQVLDISNNRIFELERDTFKYTRKLQVIRFLLRAISLLN